jgi:Ca2+-transporting ATPase
LTDEEKEKILLNSKIMSSSSLRTLAFAYKKVGSKSFDEEGLVFLGLVGMEDPPRGGVKEALVDCHRAGIKIKMITGDDKETAIAIANQIGLEKGRVLEGFELEKLSDSDLIKNVLGISIFARVKPEHKLRIVNALKEIGEVVTMTGDGVNDAPALKVANIGVAMGKSGTDVSRSVADLTLKDDNFVTLVDAIKEGRTIFTNIQKFSTYQISVNFSQVALIFFAVLIGLPLPLVAIQILFMNLFSDELTAITLAFNPYSSDVMDVRPRKRSNIITKPLLAMLIISGIVMSLGSLGVFYYSLNLGKSVMAARTVTFVTMVFFGIINAFNFRSFRKLTLNRSPFTNKALVGVSIFTLVTTYLFIYSPLHFILETKPIALNFWLLSFFVSVSVIVIFDLFKFIKNKYVLFEENERL